jgi:hypothetical protein
MQRWEYERFGERGKPYDFQRESYQDYQEEHNARILAENDKRVWVIECRTIYPGKPNGEGCRPDGEWKTEYAMTEEVALGSWEQVRFMLQHHRERHTDDETTWDEFPVRFEYRARIRRRGDVRPYP